MYSEFVESVRRLYKDSKRLSKEAVIKLYNSKKLTKKELDYILSEEVGS